MQREAGRAGVASAPQRRVTQVTATMPAIGATWDRRLYPGLRVECVPLEARAALADALGEIGVEAEHFLALVNGFPGRGAATRERGESFLLRLDVAARRLYRQAATLEMATQSYLTALEMGYPDIYQASVDADVWWQPLADFALMGEPLELRLRRCGYAYRHVVAVHLVSNVEVIVEHLTLVLRALSTLPPAGVSPASTLYRGLYELSAMFQGYLIPTHVMDMNERTPGLLTGIRQLRALDVREDTSLRADMAWAYAQYGVAYRAYHEASDATTRPWAANAARAWQDIVTSLSGLASPQERTASGM